MKNIFKRSALAVLLVAAFTAIFVSCNSDDDNSPKLPKEEDYSIIVRFDESKILVEKGFITKESIQNNSTVKAWETLNVSLRYTEDKTVDYWKINGKKDDSKNGKSFRITTITKDDCIQQEGSYVYAIEVEERAYYSVKVNYDKNLVECRSGIGSKFSSDILDGATVSEKDHSAIYFNVKEEKISSDWTNGTKTYIYGYSMDGGDTEVYYPTTCLTRYYSVDLADVDGKNINFKFLTKKEPKFTTLSFDSNVLSVSKTCYYRELKDGADDYTTVTKDVISDETPVYEGEYVNFRLASGEKIEASKIYVNGTSLEKYVRCPFLCDGKDGELKIIYSASNKIEPKDGKFTIEYK